MKLEDVLPAFRQGKEIRRKCWGEGNKTRLSRDTIFNCFEVNADDWEIVENPSERKQELAKEILKLQDQMRPMLEEWSKIE